MDWIRIENELPEDGEVVRGKVGNKSWAFKWSKEYNHFLEYIGKRNRWEYTNNSHRVIEWKPFPAPLENNGRLL